MRRPTLNFVVDAAAFVGFVFLVSTGVLMRYVLPPGSGKRAVVWGLDRHEWGALHFWIAAAFLVVLAFHLVLHGKWILSVLHGRPREGSGGRMALGLVGLLAVLALAAAPLVSPVERSGNAGPAGHEVERGGRADPGDREAERGDLRGSMTLAEVERATSVPASHVLRELGLAPDSSRDEPIGRLARQHGFRVGDVRRIVESYDGPDG
jgi:hypothetical protein